MTHTRLATAVLLTVAGLLGCGAPKPVSVLPRLMEPQVRPLQVALQVHLIAFQEPAYSRTPGAFPALGFRLEDAEIVASATPGTLAGAEMTHERFAQWQEQMFSSGATVLMAPTFTIWADQRAGISDTRDLVLHSNWLLKGDSAEPQQTTVAPGVNLTAQVRMLQGTTDMAIKLQLDLLAAQVDTYTVADTPHLEKGPMPSLLIVQLPVESVRRINATAPIRDGHSLVMAHVITQSLAPDAWRTKAVRDHLLCVVSVRRMGREPERLPNQVPEEPPRRYSAALTWCEWPAGGTGGAGESAAAQELNPADMKGSPEAVSTTVGAVLCDSLHEEDEAEVELARRTERVAGILSDAAGVRTYDIERDWSGVLFTAGAATRGSLTELRVKGAVADPPEVRDRTESFPAIRLPPTDEKGTYHFQAARQERITFDQKLVLRLGETRFLECKIEKTPDDAPFRPLNRLLAATVSEAGIPAADGNGSSARR